MGFCFLTWAKELPLLIRSGRRNSGAASIVGWPEFTFEVWQNWEFRLLFPCLTGFDLCPTDGRVCWQVPFVRGDLWRGGPSSSALNACANYYFWFW